MELYSVQKKMIFWLWVFFFSCDFLVSLRTNCFSGPKVETKTWFSDATLHLWPCKKPKGNPTGKILQDISLVVSSKCVLHQSVDISGLLSIYIRRVPNLRLIISFKLSASSAKSSPCQSSITIFYECGNISLLNRALTTVKHWLFPVQYWSV